jgi:hypothetical protein
MQTHAKYANNCMVQSGWITMGCCLVVCFLYQSTIVDPISGSNMKKTCWISAIPRLSQQYAQASQDIASSFAWQIAPVPPDDSKLEHCQVSWSHGSH